MLHAVAEAIIQELSDFLRPDAQVCGVPPAGRWEPATEYRGRKFSDFEDELLSIEKIEFGVSVRIPNTRDPECLWLRQVVTLDVEDGEVTVGIGCRALIRIPKIFDQTHVAPLIEAIFDETLRFFFETADRHRLIASGKIGLSSWRVSRIVTAPGEVVQKEAA